MACMWLKQACSGGSCGKKLPADVPRGHLAVTVGEANRRFVIRADYLNHPILQQLLDQYEGNGFNKSGPLSIPCDELLFEDIIQSLRGRGAAPESRRTSCPHVPLKDSTPLLQSFDSKRRSRS